MYFIISSRDNNSLELTRSLVKYLKKKNLDFVLDKSLKISGNKKNLNEVKPNFVLVVGDDNLFLRTFRSLGKKQIPVLGVASSQSFLSQANSTNFKERIDLIEKGKYNLYRRSRIVARLNENEAYSALNDIGIFSSKSASLIRYTLNINNEKLWKDNADGVIVSTPTGSTGYSYSAYGPIILDEPAILAITPISSTEKKSALIVPNKSKISITNIQANSPVIIMDGDVRVNLKSGDVEIEKSAYDASFVQFSKEYAIEDKLRKRTVTLTTSKTKSLPPSAKLVYKILSYEGNLTQKELINFSYLPERTVRHALELLLKQNIISKSPYLNDARQTVYGI